MNTQNKKQRFSYPQYDMLTLCVEQTTSAENQPKTDLISDFKEDILLLKSKTDAISLLIAPGKQNTTGTAKQKCELKFDLAQKTFWVSEPFIAFAARSGDMELYHAWSKPIWKYREMRPSKLISEASLLIETVTPYLSQLSGTTISQNALDEIAQARDLFAPFAAKPRSKVVSKHDKLTQMVTLLKEAMDITRMRLDHLAVGYLTLNEQSFYNQWVRCRKLTPYGTLTTRASVDVYMGDANAPIKGALVQVNNTPLKGTTNASGHTTIPRVPFKEEQFITVTAPGFPQPVKAGPFIFKKGKALHITINMNEFNIPEPLVEKVTE
jgi:hypothetical protein